MGRANQGSDLIKFINTDLFPTLKSLPDQDASNSQSVSPKVIRQVFEDSDNRMKSGTLMLGVIEKLNEAINFNDFTTRQNLGDIYEQILSDLRGAGNAGEFYTPRAITKFMVDRVNPRFDKQERLMDPACGTGGMLTATLDHLRAQLPDPQKPAPKEWHRIEQSIIGFEKKQLPHLLCTTNLLLHGVRVTDQSDRRNTLGVRWQAWQSADAVPCLATNPPFGGLEEEGVGSDYPDALRTRETANMFLTLIVDKLLKDGGRAAIVLPDGALFGEGVTAKVKEHLMKECNLHTIVRLPNGVFAPYTGIKTNLLFFTKGKPTETIWYYEHPYPPNQKSYSKTRPIRFEEFTAEQAWWGDEAEGFATRVENERAWKIDFKAKRDAAVAAAQPHWDKATDLNAEVVAKDGEVRTLRDGLKGVKDDEVRKATEEQIAGLRADAEQLRRQARDAQAAGDQLYNPIYNLDSKNPNSPAEESDDPDELLRQYKQLLADIEDTQAQLKRELGAALAHHFERERVSAGE